MARITENDILIPALYIVYKNGSATTSAIKEKLIEMFRPTGEDAEILHGRKDTKFSQIVRNLTGSHYETNKFGELTIKSKDKISLTSEGVEFIKENIDQCEYISNNFFTYEENVDVATKLHKSSKKKHNLIVYSEDDMVTEGQTKSGNSKVKSRSDKLRKAAVDFYRTESGQIKCCVCGFDFEETYGELGKDYIQIHHEHPVCQYDDDGVELFIKEAINNVKPLCANCHCMVHRNRKSIISVDELRNLIK